MQPVRVFAFSVFIFLATFSPLYGHHQAPVNRAQHALLIGNNAYRSARWHDLKAPIKDITVLAQVLHDHYQYARENVTVLENADKKSILKALYELSITVKPDDTVLIYYAGHGEYDDRDVGWWIPVGAQANYDYISNQELLTRLQLIPAGEVLLIADSCFSGSLFDNSMGNQNTLSPSIHVLSSGGTEPVFDGGEEWGGHSVFGFHFITYLKSNRLEALPFSQLARTVSRQVKTDTAAMGINQLPRYGSLSGQGQSEEFWFLRKTESLDPVRKNPVMLGLVASIPEKENAGRQFLIELQELLQKNGYPSCGRPQLIRPQWLKTQLMASFEHLECQQALVLEMDLDLKQQQTRIWAAVATVSAVAMGYAVNENNELVTRNIYRFKSQVLPIGTWEDSGVFRRTHYQSAIQKLIRLYNKTDVSAYLRTNFD